MICPHCHLAINPRLVKSEAGRLIRKPQPRQPKLSPCNWCGNPYGVAAMRKHKPRCEFNPRNAQKIETSAAGKLLADEATWERTRGNVRGLPGYWPGSKK